jgi:tetratricopeptide (TPR) repeat protein
MAKDGLSLLLCVTLLAGAVRADDRVANTLAVQAALQKGRAHIVKGDFPAAVDALESQISRIDANPQYLAALRDAYRGLIKALRLAGKEDEAAIYSRRLAILDPGSPLDFAPLKSTGTPPKPAATPAPATKAPEPKAPIVARAKSLDETPKPAVDPFNEANSKKAHEARSLVAEADRLFKAENYGKAGELYNRASDLCPAEVADAKERWAYCQMHDIVARLNATDRPIAAPEWQTLEQQVRRAMAMTPKLETFGSTLLMTIQGRKSTPTKQSQIESPALPEVEVKHSRSAGAALSMAETTNFRIFHQLDEAQAEEVARGCEAARVAAQKRWFGKVLDDWTPRCDVYLHADADAYSRETGVAGGVPGHADIGAQGERVVKRKLHFRLDHPNVLKTVLPHETAHVVFAGNFGTAMVPRWADEGMAVMSEPREMIEKHLKNLPAHRDAQQLFKVRDLMESRDYPAPRLIGAFYAQSVSLVEYLSGLKGPQTFAQFLTESMKSGGYEPALKKYYAIEGYNELQAKWTAHALGKDAGIAKRGEE